MATKTISLSISKGQQSIDYSETLNVENFKLRIRMKSDSYAEQSFAVVELWSGKEWNEIHRIHYRNMKTPIKLKYNAENQGQQTPEQTLTANKPHFNSDRKELLRVAKEVLF